MREVVTAKGKVLNMAALASANEKEIAVGNMDVNARGDVFFCKNKMLPFTISKSQVEQNPRSVKS